VIGRVGNEEIWAREESNNVEGKIVISKEERKKKGGCLEKLVIDPRYEVTSSKIVANIQYMKDYTIIGKFMGIWSAKKSLI
jgi:hypothetical protein